MKQQIAPDFSVSSRFCGHGIGLIGYTIVRKHAEKARSNCIISASALDDRVIGLRTFDDSRCATVSGSVELADLFVRDALQRDEGTIR